MVIGALWLACATAPVDSASPGPTLPEADAVTLLNRASLDLRGRRPTQAELEAVEADPAALDALLDEMVDDPGFPERLVALYAEVFRTRADRFLVSLDNDVDFLDTDRALAFKHAVGEEPLRLVAYLAEQELPYTELVTADYTLANPLLLEHLPLEALEEGEGWVPARYLDDRPAAGVLSSTGLWWRYTSTFENANRGRAQAIGRILLCDDRFEAAVSFQGTTADLEERVRTDPSCTGCHATLDPLGSYLWGFVWRNQEAWLEVTRYNPTQEGDWAVTTGISPELYGQPGHDLRGLGRQLAADPRFVGCAVETAMELLLNRGLQVEDARWFTQHREDFLDSGLSLKALYRSVVDNPVYRAADSDEDWAAPLRTVRPDQLAGSLEALTGYRWTWQGNDMLDTDARGVRVLIGGVDGVLATSPAADPSTTTVLALERVAEAAAQWAVGREGELDPAERTLFLEVDLTADPGDAAVAVQVQALLLRCHGRRHALDSELVLGLTALWRALADSTQSPRQAWVLVLSGIFRHPDFLVY